MQNHDTNMGCNICKNKGLDLVLKANSEDVVEAKKEYSWDKKEKVNAKDFIFENLNGETVVKLSGTINGQQFIIQNCANCNIYLFDHVNTITVDDCTNCNMILGPTKGSVFIRNCTNCRLISACQQFRTRDCQRVDISLCSTTHPIIEASNNMRFGCYCCSYPELESQFQNARLSVFNNDWCDVRDFTPVEEQRNWSLIPDDVKIEELIPYPSIEELSHVKLSFSPSDWIVPYTCGNHNKASDESSIVLFFNVGQTAQKRAQSFICSVLNSTNLRLVRTKELKISASDTNRILQTSSYSLSAEQGPIIGLEINGKSSIEVCQKLASDMLTESPDSVYVSSTSMAAAKQIKYFFDMTDMQMAG